MVMTLRPSSSHRSGSRQIHRSWKKRIMFAAMSCPSWLFFPDIQDTIHKEFVPAGQTVGGKFYREVFEAAEGGHLVWTSR